MVSSAGSRVDDKARADLAKLAGSKEWKTYDEGRRIKLINNILSRIPVVGGAFKKVTKSCWEDSFDLLKGETEEEEYVGHDEKYDFVQGEKAGREEEKKPN